MKIAVVSLPLNDNYGGILQAWALQHKLCGFGHSVELIDAYPPKDLDIFRKLIHYPVRAALKMLRLSNAPIRREYMSSTSYWILMKNILPFIDANINIRRIRTVNEIRPSDYDLIIFGSDQVWRPAYARGRFGNMPDVFGWFAKEWNNVRLGSYAASFGLDNLSEYSRKELNNIRKILKKFTNVSVREDSGKKLCQELGVEATHDLDPTMLFDKEDYIDIIKRSNLKIETNKGIMSYILDSSPETDKIVNKVATLSGKDVFSNITSAPPREPIEQWLANFSNADIVLTDSFHACVFSIIFNKPFIVSVNANRGLARITSLLKTFELRHHLVTKAEDITDLERFILDKNKTREILLSKRKQSIKHLSSML